MITITRDIPTYASGLAKDGQPLELLPASKRDFEKIAAFGAGFAKKSTTEQLDETYRLFALILSNNTARLAVTEEELADVDPLTAAKVIRGYMDFMRGLEKLPNSGSRTVPTTGTAQGTGTTS